MCWFSWAYFFVGLGVGFFCLAVLFVCFVFVFNMAAFPLQKKKPLKVITHFFCVHVKLKKTKTTSEFFYIQNP